MELSESALIHYEGFPPSSVRLQFLDHVKATGAPEIFRGLAFDEPPDRLEGSRIVADFEVSRKKRPESVSELIFCTQCNRPKFLKGAMIWSPDGYLRLVGHQCARKHFGDTYDYMVKEYDERQEYERNREFLIDHHAAIPQFYAEIAKLHKSCEVLHDARQTFKTAGAEVFRVLRKANKTGGELRVTSTRGRTEGQQVFEQESGTKSDPTQIVHQLSGREFLRESFKPLAEYATAAKHLTIKDISTAEKCFEYIATLERGGPKSLSQFAAEFRQALGNARSLIETLQNAARFFTSQNLTGLKKYGQHPDGDVPFTVSFDETLVVIQVRGAIRPCRLLIGTSFHIPEVLLPEIAVQNNNVERSAEQLQPEDA